LQDKIFSQLLDLTILNSFTVSCENVTSLRIMMEHAAKGRTPAVKYNISPRTGQWISANLLSQQNVMSRVLRAWEEPEYNDKMHEKCRVGLCILVLHGLRSRAIQYLSVILRKNSLLYIRSVMSLINTSSSKQAFTSQVYSAGPEILKMLILNCFLEVVLSEICYPTLSAWKPPPSLSLQNKCHIHTANISRQCSYLACVGYASLYL
jgi:hypothetical protein